MECLYSDHEGTCQYFDFDGNTDNSMLCTDSSGTCLCECDNQARERCQEYEPAIAEQEVNGHDHSL